MALFVKPAFISVLSATFHVTTRTKGTDIMSWFSVTTTEERGEKIETDFRNKFIDSALEYLLHQISLLRFIGLPLILNGCCCLYFYFGSFYIFHHNMSTNFISKLLCNFRFIWKVSNWFIKTFASFQFQFFFYRFSYCLHNILSALTAVVFPEILVFQ